MKKQDKALMFSILIFVIAAIIALVIILNKGSMFTKSIVEGKSGGSEISAEAPLIQIEADKEYLSVKEKEKATLTVKADGAVVTEGVEYVSSDEAVATIEDGIVTPVGVGSVTVTAKYKGGESTTDLKVINPIKSMKFTATSSTIRVGNDLQLKLQVTPSDASIDTLIYSSSNDEIATVNKNGIVTGVQRGQVTITLLDEYTGAEKSVKLTIR